MSLNTICQPALYSLFSLAPKAMDPTYLINPLFEFFRFRVTTQPVPKVSTKAPVVSTEGHVSTDEPASTQSVQIWTSESAKSYTLTVTRIYNTLQNHSPFRICMTL